MLWVRREDCVVRPYVSTSVSESAESSRKRERRTFPRWGSTIREAGKGSQRWVINTEREDIRA